MLYWRFLDSLRNCWLPIAVGIWRNKRNNPSHKHAFTDESRKRDVSLQNRFRQFVSDYDMKQCVETFFSMTICFDF